MGYRLIALLAASLVGPAVSAGSTDGAYAPDGRLRAPDHYREWVFLSSGLDMNYDIRVGPAGESMFDNVFVDPVSYAAFLKTGTWPDGTLLVKEDRGASKKGSINRHGKFQTSSLRGLEVHARDSARFAGGWAFFFFAAAGAEPAQPIPASASCYSCHKAHGAVDTTFVQFYPTLLPVATDKKTLSSGYHP